MEFGGAVARGHGGDTETVINEAGAVGALVEALTVGGGILK